MGGNGESVPEMVRIDFNDPDSVASALNGTMKLTVRKMAEHHKRMQEIREHAMSLDPAERDRSKDELQFEMYQMLREQNERQVLMMGALFTLVCQHRRVIPVGADPRFSRGRQ